MSRNVHLFFTKKLNEHINIEKLGIIFRPLTIEEKNNILDDFDYYYFNKRAKNIIKNFLEFKNSKDLEIYNNKRKYNNFKNYTDEQRIAALITEKYKQDNLMFNKNIVKKRLDKIVIVEFSDKITKYVDADLDCILLSNIIKILLYKKRIFNIKKLKEKTICNPSFCIFSEDISLKSSTIMNYISKDCPNIIEELDINLQDLIQFKDFINYLSVDRIRDFTTSIDSIFTKNISIDNILLNYVSCIERILVKYEKNEKYDIGRQIFLKYGLCINEKSNIDIDEHIKSLKYCYEIRSCVIHGNDNDLFTAPQRILKIQKKEIEKFINSEKYSNNRFANIYFAIMYLEDNLDVLYRNWIENPSKIEFLKNN